MDLARRSKGNDSSLETRSKIMTNTPLSNAIPDQRNWLFDLPQGVRVVAHNGVWIHPKWPNTQYFAHWVNVDTGEIVLYAYLANEQKPPQLESKPSPCYGYPKSSI